MDGCFTVAIVNRILLSLLSFATDISLALHQSSKPVLIGRRKRSYSPPLPKVGKKPTLPKPVADARYDLIDHFPEFTEKRGRCRFCPMGYSYVIYNKCHITLFMQGSKLLL